MIINRNKAGRMVAMQACEKPRLKQVTDSPLRLRLRCEDINVHVAPDDVRVYMSKLARDSAPDTYRVRGYVESVVDQYGQALLSSVLGWIILRDNVTGQSADDWLRGFDV